MCMTISGTSGIFRISGSNVSPDTSLTMFAPTAIAARATFALRVSMEIVTSLRRRMSSITGTTRAISSSIETGAAPGRVDSPPTSMIVAPSSIICSAACSAFVWSKWTPPSEKESGVTFRMPMTAGVIGLLVPFPPDARAEGIQPLLDALVAAVDLMNVVDHALPFCAERGEEQRHAGADVGAGDLGALQPRTADDDGAMRIAEDDPRA